MPAAELMERVFVFLQDKLVAARAKNGVLPWGMVYFRFFTSLKKYATECTVHYSCPFCRQSMKTFAVCAPPLLPLPPL